MWGGAEIYLQPALQPHHSQLSIFSIRHNLDKIVEGVHIEALIEFLVVREAVGKNTDAT
jgi:hypothetical protein